MQFFVCNTLQYLQIYNNCSFIVIVTAIGRLLEEAMFSSVKEYLSEVADTVDDVDWDKAVYLAVSYTKAVFRAIML